VGLALPGAAVWLPVASMMTDGSGWPALGVSLAMGALASFLFGLRTRP
jgi:hypothetical protein